jgi:hypothetical protein
VICAVLPPGDARVAAAVDAQDRAPDERAAGPGDPRAREAAWLWLLDGTAVPRPGALRALLEAAERLEPVCPPAALASRIVAGADGRLAPAHAPIAPQGQTHVAMKTVGLRVLPVRAVTGGSLLVRAADAPGPGREPALVWTARLLRDRPGFLVPASLADARADPPRATARLLLGGALRGSERVRLAAEVAERLVRRPSGV